MNIDPALLPSTDEEDPLGKIHKVTVLYNIVNNLQYGETNDVLADADTVQTAHEVGKILNDSGFIVDLFNLNEQTLSTLLDVKTDIIFNLCYGIGALPQTEAEVVKILESLGIPFTGAGHNEITQTTDKLATKKKFYQCGVSTPKYQLFVSQSDTLDSEMQFPLIVKPVREDCSLGIHNNSVVTDIKALRNKVKFIINTYKEPALVESYIDGRELNITLLGNQEKARVLPISEIIFGNSFSKKNKRKIVDFEAKWLTDSENFRDTPGICPASLEKEVLTHIENDALKIYYQCGCQDYARIDLRLKDSIPYFLEVNLNPGIGPEDGAVRSAKAAGMSYNDFLKNILRSALLRYN